MNVLFLTQILPYPPNAGPRVKTWQVLRYLVEAGHKVTLVSFLRPEEAPFADEVRQLVDDLRVIPFERRIIREMVSFARACLKNRPFLVERDADRRMQQAIEEILAGNSIDIIHLDQVTMTQFVLEKDMYPRVFDAHNATWQILRGAKSHQPVWRRPIIAREVKAMKVYEGKVVSTFEHTLAVTQADKGDLIEAVRSQGPLEVASDGKIKVVPISVDVEQFSPAEPAGDSLEILSIGSLHYAPNADGVRWFLREVLPRVLESSPEAKTVVIGKDPPADFQRIADQSKGRIQVKGYVPDLDPYFARAALMVVPVLAGSGMRVRILEGLARGMPMVTSSLGAQGIEVRSGEEILIADSSQAFSQAVLTLLSQPELRKAMSKSARKLAVEKYDWRKALTPMAEIYR